jgi:hypothetical protein
MGDYDFRRPFGFRLIDLIVVIIIIVILIGLLLPATRRVHDNGPRVQCQNNLKQIALGIHDYASAYQNQLPAVAAAPIQDGIAHPQSAFFALLPFIEEDFLYKDGMKDPRGQTWNAISEFSKGPIFSTRFVKTYYCASDVSNSTSAPLNNGWVGCSYAINAQVFGSRAGVVKDPKGVSWNELTPGFNIGNIPDGTSNVLFVAERFALAGGPGGTPCAWADPPAGGAGLGNAERDAMGCPLQTFVNNRGSFRASVCGPVTFLGAGAVGDPVGARGGVWKYPLPEIDQVPAAASTDGRPQSGHRAVVQVAMGDGSARGITASVSQVTWARVICPDDGQELGSDW